LYGQNANQTHAVGLRKPVAAVWWCGAHVFWGTYIRKRAQANGRDDDDEKTKQTLSNVDVDVYAGGRTRLTNTSRGVSVPTAQGRTWDRALNNLTGSQATHTDHVTASRLASVAAFCVREALSN